MYSKRWANISVLFVLCVAGAGCGPSATLTYRQLGACDDYAPGFLMAGANKAYVFFRMDSLDNASSTSVNFDPFQLYVPSVGQIDQMLSFEWAQTLQGPEAASVTVAAGKVQSLIGWGVMLVSTDTTDGAVEANKTAYFLVDAPGSNILPVSETPNQTSWPYTRDCGSIDFVQQ
jgi:hypothetical protein